MFAFRNLPKLKTLIINNNPKLVDLEGHAFGSLKNLNFLSLSYNQFSVIDGYIFSSSTSIKTIDFIGNPIKKIKSCAFHGLRNVSELLLSLNQNVTPIEIIEGDSFISTAFVDQIFLQGIPAKNLSKHAFRGLSYCKNLYLSNTHIEEIEANSFFGANHINNVDLKNSRIKVFSRNAFTGMYNIDTIDLRSNYISKLDQNTFEPLIAFNINMSQLNIINATSSITLIEKNDKYLVGKILFQQNPIQCDCSLDWIIKNKVYNKYVGLPEICAGPKGYDCLRISELKYEMLATCSTLNNKANKMMPPCDEIKFTADKFQTITDKNLNIPDNENYNSENNNDLLDNYDDEYVSSGETQPFVTQVITPVHIIDLYAPNPITENVNNNNKKNQHKTKPQLNSTVRRLTTSSSSSSTSTSRSINTKSTTQKQLNHKNNKEKDRIVDYSNNNNNNNSVASLSNSVNLLNKCSKTKRYLYLNSIIIIISIIMYLYKV